MSEDTPPTSEGGGGAAYTTRVALPIGDTRWMAKMTWMPADGRMECVGIELRSYPLPEDKRPPRAKPYIPTDQPPRPVTAALMRGIPWASVIRESRDDATDMPDVRSQFKNLPQQFESLFGQWPKTPSRRGHGPGHFADVAAVWQEAWQSSNTPTLAVQERFHVSYSTAAHWVGRARKMGLLPASPKAPKKTTKSKRGKR